MANNLLALGPRLSLSSLGLYLCLYGAVVVVVAAAAAAAASDADVVLSQLVYILSEAAETATAAMASIVAK